MPVYFFISLYKLYFSLSNKLRGEKVRVLGTYVSMSTSRAPYGAHEASSSTVVETQKVIKKGKLNVSSRITRSTNNVPSIFVLPFRKTKTTCVHMYTYIYISIYKGNDRRNNNAKSVPPWKKTGNSGEPA